MRKMITTLLLIATAMTTALIAGLFYSYSCSVNPGLSALPDREYLAAMQSINTAILNPLFFMSFMGTLIFLPLSSYLNYQQEIPGRFIFLVAATIVYVFGVFGTTVWGNVPLNEQLVQIDLSSASVEEITKQRINFEIPWNRFHTVRTIASVITLLLVLMACVKQKQVF